METSTSRRDADVRLAATLEDDVPALAKAIEGTRRVQRRARVQSAIDPRGSGRLRHWIAVAVWDTEDGSFETEVLHDDGCTELEMKGYLHDAIWKTAHLT